jgi:Protein of unknown function (DUF3303)
MVARLHALRQTPRVRYMVIETYTSGPSAVYRRAAQRGRMLPPGLTYIDSWVVDDDALDRCFQLMETDDPALFDEWVAAWSDLATFEIHPVIDSAQAAARVEVRWGGAG